jgi:hypothetical protein
MIRNCIPSNKEELNNLNITYSWIPNDKQIRPTEIQQLEKYFLMSKINYEWKSTKDYILNQVFGQNFVIENNKKIVKHINVLNEWVFEESMFKYNVEANHYILWNINYDYYKDFDVKFINEIITTNLQNKLKHDKFDFAWYKNPKPTVPEIYHIQVFWIDLSH